MNRSRYSEEKIPYALKLAESGTAVGDVCRQMGISEATFTSGRRSTAVSVWRSSASFVSCGMRTAS